MDKFEFVWDQIKHDDLLFTERANFFLVAESILLGAYATLGSATPPPKVPIHGIGLAGIVLGSVWIWTTYRHIEAREILGKELQTELKKEGAPFIADHYPLKLPKPGAHVLMGYLIPGILLSLWIFWLLG